MNNRIAAFAVVLAFGLVVAPALGQSQMLQGRIEHSDTVEPVGEEYRPGATLSSQTLKGELNVQGNIWFEIPFWLAGTWQQNYSTQIRVYKYATGQTETPNKVRKDAVTRTYGDQMDDNGRIWCFDNCPFAVTGSYEDKNTYSIFRSFQPVEISRDSVTFRSLQLSVLSDPRTQTVVATTVKESITKFQRTGKNRCTTVSSVKVFDVDGNPLEIYDVTSTRARTVPFTARETDGGRNLPDLFQRFLAQRRLLN
jgi:hypothetical protein